MLKFLFKLLILIFLFLGELSILNPSFGKDAIVQDEVANTAGEIPDTDLDSFRRQLASNWSIPAGSKEVQGYVEIKVEMNPDATVHSAIIVNTSKPMSDPSMKSFADSARRAVLNAGPLKLPLDRYEYWKTITIRFDL